LLDNTGHNVITYEAEMVTHCRGDRQTFWTLQEIICTSTVIMLTQIIRPDWELNLVHAGGDVVA